MKIHFYSVIWNERRILPFFFRHYNRFVEKFIFYDDGSNDGTLEYLADLAKVEVRPLDRGTESIVQIGRQIKSQAWKESRGQADLVIVADVDEFLWHPDLENYLQSSVQQGVTVFRPQGWNMIAREFPPPGVQLYEAVRTGVRDPQFDKLVCFDPNAITEINYVSGCHAAKPEGRVRQAADPQLRLLHFKALGPDYLRERYTSLGARLLPLDREKRWGWQYLDPEAEVRKFYQPGPKLDDALQVQPLPAGNPRVTTSPASKTTAKPATGFLLNSGGDPADWLANQYQGASCFLVCGGPSLRETPLELLHQRGILTAAVNQAAATHVRPDLWFSVDEPAHFHEAIWTDPAIAKFVRIDRAGKMTVRREGENWVSTGRAANSYPNTWFYRYANGLEVDKFLTNSRPYWSGIGQLNGRDRETRSVLLVALRMLHWLGCREVILVGADFQMTESATYAFDETKDATACARNNNTYQVLSQWLGELQPHFAQHGLRVWNATVGGQLESLPRIEFRQAVARAKEHFPRVDTVRGHYRAGA